MEFAKLFIVLAFVVVRKEVVSYTYHLDEVSPQFYDSINYRTDDLTFTTNESYTGGKYAISVTLVIFSCALENDTEDAPYLEVRMAPDEPSTIWKCNNSYVGSSYALASLSSGTGNITISRPMESNWSRNWGAYIVGTLYQIADECPYGYFDCNQQNPNCPQGSGDSAFLGNSSSPSHCISTSLVCDNLPSCGMLCNPDEALDRCYDYSGGSEVPVGGYFPWMIIAFIVVIVIFGVCVAGGLLCYFVDFMKNLSLSPKASLTSPSHQVTNRNMKDNNEV